MLNSQTYLENITEIIPYFVFWKNVDSVYLGCNQKFATLLGKKSPNEVIGKTDFDLGWRKEEAELFLQGDKKTMSGHPIINTEEILMQPDGSNVVMLVNKVPLLDADGHCVGILGTSTDITEHKQAKEKAEKEAEKVRELKLENDRQQIAFALKEKEKHITLAHQVAHDICSPLSALNMMMPFCDDLPESKRTIIKRATESILDIANNLLSTYRNKTQPADSTMEERQLVLVSDMLHQLLSEKKVQYCNCAIRFSIDIADDAQFIFIDVQSSAFRRSLSNLINNAVDALSQSRHGLVTLCLTTENDIVSVAVQDNGKGMSVQNVQRITQHQEFTDGKAQGHGLGLQQVWATLAHNAGKLEVQSTLEKGTTMQLTFPRAPMPNWIVPQLNLMANQVVVILDDEESIHGAWDMRFAPLLAHYSELDIYHFTQGQETLEFIAHLNQTKKDRVLLLSDYELLRQPRNGLEIIEASQINQSVLVTSHYTNPTVREAASTLQIKILPKQMASVIPIHVK